MALLRSVATVGSYTMVSRVLGFVRDILTAAILGAGPVADAFFVAQRLPNLFRSLFAEGAFSAAFVPLANRCAGRGRQAGAASEFAEEAYAVLVAALVGVCRARRNLHAAGHARRSRPASRPSRQSSSSSSR